MSMLPPARPRISRAEVEADLQLAQADFAKHPIIVVGYRGYYRDSMGQKGVNDHGIYDDALIIITQWEFHAFNGNTDPTAKEGTRTGRATLTPGWWPMWKLDHHKGQYLALCQRKAPCTVFRTGTLQFKVGVQNDYGRCLGEGKWTGYFGINLHRGGQNLTSSEGCQTIPEPQWTEFIGKVSSEAKRLWGTEWKDRTIPYLLVHKA
jgi:lysozyme